MSPYNVGFSNLNEMDEVHITLEDILFDIHMVDVRHMLVRLWCAMLANRRR